MTTLPSRRTPYFVAGGTLTPDVPSYVKRPTDDELFERLLAGELCYVPTPRQMGTSSLVKRTIVRLMDEQIEATDIDLQGYGGLDEETFYFTILNELHRAFNLDVDIEAWWDENNRLGKSLRFRRFFTDHLLLEINGRVVIFIDEIDMMLTMSFRDNFFAAIRLLFNARSGNPELERLTFVLLGVASPSELIADSTRTPFNIGKKINLREFEPTDVEPLLKGLEKEHPEQAKAILERIFYWTSGHPYLTQQLCLLINQATDRDWHDAEIDELVLDNGTFDDHLPLLSLSIRTEPKLQQALLQIIRTRKCSDEDALFRLQKAGLVTQMGGIVTCRCVLYEQYFSQEVNVQGAKSADEKYVSEQAYLTEVHELVVKHFDEEELKTLCFNLGVAYDNLRGEGKANKARELVLELKRNERIAELKNEVIKKRPHISWPDRSQGLLSEPLRQKL